MPVTCKIKVGQSKRITNTSADRLQCVVGEKVLSQHRVIAAVHEVVSEMPFPSSSHDKWTAVASTWLGNGDSSSQFLPSQEVCTILYHAWWGTFVRVLEKFQVSACLRNNVPFRDRNPELITDSKLPQKIFPESRSLGFKGIKKSSKIGA